MNYIMLNGQKIEITKEQAEEIKASFGSSVKLKDIPVGETFKIGGREFVVLEHSRETTAVILKELLFGSKQFGKQNNYENSYVDDLCNDFATEISDIVGSDNIVEHTVDLTSDDGLDDYGTIKRKVSLLTCDLYRRYVRIMDKHKISKWWWLATPYSTPTHEDTDWIKCVSPIGLIDCYDYYGNGGVRPFCTLKSNIFVSK